MPEFEIQNGFVSIDDEKLDITARPITGLKQWYQERKSTLLFLPFALLIYAILAIYDLGPAREFFAILFTSVAGMMFVWLLTTLTFLKVKQ
jgi:hypothetical protein